MKILIGKKYLHHTFAGVKVISKIIEKEAPGIYMGQLTRRSDVKNLKKASVAYKGDEPLGECIGVVYEWQVIKRVK